MTKKDLFLIILLIFALIAALVFESLWIAKKDELALARIAGHAYVDSGIIGALDNSDWPVAGLKIQLFEAYENVVVKETTVNSNGEYTFTVEPGTYYVLPVYGVPGYPAWNWITYLRSGNIRTEEGGLYSGPIFLVREDGNLG